MSARARGRAPSGGVAVLAPLATAGFKDSAARLVGVSFTLAIRFSIPEMVLLTRFEPTHNQHHDSDS